MKIMYEKRIIIKAKSPETLLLCFHSFAHTRIKKGKKINRDPIRILGGLVIAFNSTKRKFDGSSA